MTLWKSRYQKVKPVRFEQSFEGLYPTKRIAYDGWPKPRKMLDQENSAYVIEFEGSGFVISGNARRIDNNLPHHDLKVDVYINGEFVETSVMPTRSLHRKLDICWNYELFEGNHEVKLVTNDIPRGYQINVGHTLVYSRNDPGPQNY